MPRTSRGRAAVAGVVALALAAAAVVAALAVRGDGSRAAARTEVEAFVRKTFAAYNEKDGAQFLSAWTDAGYAGLFGVGKREARDLPPSLSGVRSFRESVVEVEAVEATEVADDSAGARVVLTEEHVVRTLELELAGREGKWRIARAVEVPTDVPEGASVVHVRLREFALELQPPPRARDTVLELENSGDLRHQLLLLRLREGGQEESIGRVEGIAPGSSARLVLVGLRRGRYAIVCNLLAPDGTPHSSLGMRAELEIE